MKTCLVKSDEDVTADTSGEVDFGLKIKLDSDHEGGRLEAAVVVDGTAKEVAYVR